MQFWGPMPWMIEIAVIVEIIEKDWVDFGVLFALLLMNGLIGWYEDLKAGNAVEDLKKSIASEELVETKRGNRWIQVNATELVPAR